MNLPVRRSLFDVCICIAVIHHYSLLERRRKAVEELISTVRCGGKILIYVWALEQEYHKLVFCCHTFDEHNIAFNSPIHFLNEQIYSIVILKHVCNCRIKSKYLREVTNDISDSPTSLPTSNEDNTSYRESTSNKPKYLPVHKNKRPFLQQDVLVPWHRKMVRRPCPEDKTKNEKKPDEKTFHRYYHVFKQKELTDLCGNFPNVTVLESYYDEGNWCIVLQRIA